MLEKIFERYPEYEFNTADGFQTATECLNISKQ